MVVKLSPVMGSSVSSGTSVSAGIVDAVVRSSVVCLVVFCTVVGSGVSIGIVVVAVGDFVDDFSVVVNIGSSVSSVSPGTIVVCFVIVVGTYSVVTFIIVEL